MKQTAVDWLVDEVNSDCLNSTFIRPELLEKSKAMEKEQIIDAYQSDRFPCSEQDAKQYYNETFEK